MGKAVRVLSKTVGAGFALGLFLSGGCGDTNTNVFVTPPDQPGAAPVVNVVIPQGAAGEGSAGFGPNPLVIQKNTTIVWTNSDTEDHTVTSKTGDFDSGVLRPGDTFRHTFPTPGSFDYFCRIHGEDSHSGSVLVRDVAPTPTSTLTPSPTPSPSPSPSVTPTVLPTVTPSPSPIFTSTLPLPIETPSAEPAVSPTPKPTVVVNIEAGASSREKDAFGVNPLRIPPGVTVRWVNGDQVPHTVTSESDQWRSEVIDPGKDFEVTFDQPGEYPYFCEIHPNMKGTVLVEPGTPIPTPSG